MKTAKGLKITKDDLQIPKLLNRFIKKINFKGQNDCWEWTSSILKNGYGTFYYKGKRIYAHRFAYVLFIKPIPDRKLICHTCDNPSCVNYKHLFLGTNQDNVNDRNQKGKVSKGEKHPNSKLTESQVIEIKKALLKPYKGQINDLAKKYNVSIRTIENIKYSKTWNHIKV